MCVRLCEWGKRERQKQTGEKECNSSLKGQIPRWCMVFTVRMCMWIVEMGVGGERQQNYKFSYHFTEQCEEWGFWVLCCWAHDTILAPFPLLPTQTYIQLQAQQIAFRLMLWVMTRVTLHFCSIAASHTSDSMQLNLEKWLFSPATNLICDKFKSPSLPWAQKSCFHGLVLMEKWWKPLGHLYYIMKIDKSTHLPTSLLGTLCWCIIKGFMSTLKW